MNTFLRGLTFLLCSYSATALNDATRTELNRGISGTLAAFGATSVSVAVVVEDGKLAYAKAFGLADVARNVAATTATRYTVGSTSKQFTAAALLIAQEQGKLSIDDKVGKYAPELSRANEVSIRQLLSQTSGYEDYATQGYIIPAWTRATTARAIMDTWAKKPLNFDPGTKWQYSNTNYVIAGSILERIEGQSLVSFLQEHFFGPLGMQSAGEWIRQDGTDAAAYTIFALRPPRPVAREGEGWYFGAGELSMAPSDLASRQGSATILNGDSAPAIKQDRLIKQVLEDLQRGDLEKELFTDDAQQYFSDTARRDYKVSLSGMGKLLLLSRQNDQQRGGMTHLTYRAHFQQNSVSLNIYLLPDGKIEQFLVEEQF